MNQTLPVLYLPKNFFKIIIWKVLLALVKIFSKANVRSCKTDESHSSKSDIYFWNFLKSFLISIIWPKTWYPRSLLHFKYCAFFYSFSARRTFFLCKFISNLLWKQSRNTFDCFNCIWKFDSSILQTLSPVILNFPSLDERSEIEVLQLTLSMIQQESIRLAKIFRSLLNFTDTFCKYS